MRPDARTRAERCFALARSTTFPAEREAAIKTGTRIAQVAGEDLDTFDIPGRPRISPPRAAAGPRCAPFVVAREDDLAAALDRLRATMARQAAAAGAAPDETVHDARLRNFHRAAAEARARDARRAAA